ncbi:MAG: hypothetical protein B6I20_12505 [Bacteroidetes bacterium 4572_117]|nr:MAG: hypothetical protein B6I20_12505 [Bacteroidetes bacterium 4572_117]
MINLDVYYESFTGSFVLLDLNTGYYKIYNDSISSQRYSPCSTFKIANSLIGLESKVAKNADYLIKYDSIKNPAEPWMLKREPFKYWMQDHTLKTAIKNSVVWYYRELATRIGNKNMTKLLGQIDYGNNNISSGIDNFWLCGSLKISAKEQVEFIKKLYYNQVSGFSDKSQKIVKNIMLNETTDNYKLYGKTGGGGCFDDKKIGWYVGFVETNTGSYVFAMNIIVNDFSYLMQKKQVSLTKKVLRDYKIINY